MVRNAPRQTQHVGEKTFGKSVTPYDLSREGHALRRQRDCARFDLDEMLALHPANHLRHRWPGYLKTFCNPRLDHIYVILRKFEDRLAVLLERWEKFRSAVGHGQECSGAPRFGLARIFAWVDRTIRIQATTDAVDRRHMANRAESSDEQQMFRGLASRTILIAPILFVSLALPHRVAIRWSAVYSSIAILAVITVILIVMARRSQWSDLEPIALVTNLAAFVAVFLAMVASNDVASPVPFALIPLAVFASGNKNRWIVFSGWAYGCVAYIAGLMVIGLAAHLLFVHAWIFAGCTAVAVMVTRFLILEAEAQRARATNLALLASVTARSSSVDRAAADSRSILEGLTGCSSITLIADEGDRSDDEASLYIPLARGGIELSGATDRSQLEAIADLFQQVDERERQVAELQRLTRTDPLTGVGNRLVIEELLEEDIANRQLTVVMLDLDHFKAYNDEYGHLAGDEALRQFAATLSESVRAPDLVIRWGGEEFCLVLETDCKVAQHIIERIRSSWADRSKVTFSAGIARALPNPTENTSLIDRADAALYRAKSAGRDTTVTDSTKSVAHLIESAADWLAI